MRDVPLTRKNVNEGIKQDMGRRRIKMGHGRQVQGRDISCRVTADSCWIKRKEN